MTASLRSFSCCFCAFLPPISPPTTPAPACNTLPNTGILPKACPTAPSDAALNPAPKPARLAALRSITLLRNGSAIADLPALFSALFAASPDRAATAVPILGLRLFRPPLIPSLTKSFMPSIPPASRSSFCFFILKFCIAPLRPPMLVIPVAASDTIDSLPSEKSIPSPKNSNAPPSCFLRTFFANCARLTRVGLFDLSALSIHSFVTLPPQ